MSFLTFAVSIKLGVMNEEPSFGDKRMSYKAKVKPLTSNA